MKYKQHCKSQMQSCKQAFKGCPANQKLKVLLHPQCCLCSQLRSVSSYSFLFCSAVCRYTGMCLIFLHPYREMPDFPSSLQGDAWPSSILTWRCLIFPPFFLFFLFSFYWVSKRKKFHHEFHILPCTAFGWPPATLVSSASMKWLRIKR